MNGHPVSCFCDSCIRWVLFWMAAIPVLFIIGLFFAGQLSGCCPDGGCIDLFGLVDESC